MAWGYWSASAVLGDRGRSPRRCGGAALAGGELEPDEPEEQAVEALHQVSAADLFGSSAGAGGTGASRRGSLELGGRARRDPEPAGGSHSAGSTLTRQGSLAGGTGMAGMAGVLDEYLPPLCPHHRVLVHLHHPHHHQPHQHHQPHYEQLDDAPEPAYATGRCPPPPPAPPPPCNACLMRDISHSMAAFERLLMDGLSNI